MPGTNDFLPFATGVGANVVDQATWAAAAALLSDGFSAGIAQSAYLNKAWRQSSTMSAVLGQFIATLSGDNVLDNGDIDAIVASLQIAVAQSAVRVPPTVITDGANFVVGVSEYLIGLNRTTGLIALQLITLPNGAQPGDEYAVQDLIGPGAGGLSTNPARLSPPAGTIAGLTHFDMVEDRMKATFTYYGSNLWGVAVNG